MLTVFNGLFGRSDSTRFEALRTWETVKTVKRLYEETLTGLKPGENEMKIFERQVQSTKYKAQSSLLHKRDPRSVLPAHSIVKTAKGNAIDVVLQIPWVEMIREIENFQPQFCSILLERSRQTHTSRNL